jgi:hypothetical protein
MPIYATASQLRTDIKRAKDESPPNAADAHDPSWETYDELCRRDRFINRVNSYAYNLDAQATYERDLARVEAQSKELEQREAERQDIAVKKSADAGDGNAAVECYRALRQVLRDAWRNEFASLRQETPDPDPNQYASMMTLSLESAVAMVMSIHERRYHETFARSADMKDFKDHYAETVAAHNRLYVRMGALDGQSKPLEDIGP